MGDSLRCSSFLGKFKMGGAWRVHGRFPSLLIFPREIQNGRCMEGTWEIPFVAHLSSGNSKWEVHGGYIGDSLRCSSFLGKFKMGGAWRVYRRFPSLLIFPREIQNGRCMEGIS